MAVGTGKPCLLVPSREWLSRNPNGNTSTYPTSASAASAARLGCMREESEFGFGLSCRPVRLSRSLHRCYTLFSYVRSTSSSSVWVGLMTAALPHHNAITSKCLVALVGNGSKEGNEQRSKSLRLLLRNKEPFLKIAFPIICSHRKITLTDGFPLFKADSI